MSGVSCNGGCFVLASGIAERARSLLVSVRKLSEVHQGMYDSCMYVCMFVTHCHSNMFQSIHLSMKTNALRFLKVFQRMGGWEGGWVSG